MTAHPPGITHHRDVDISHRGSWQTSVRLVSCTPGCKCIERTYLVTLPSQMQVHRIEDFVLAECPERQYLLSFSNAHLGCQLVTALN